jgi:hypothetical protein
VKKRGVTQDCVWQFRSRHLYIYYHKDVSVLRSQCFYFVALYKGWNRLRFAIFPGTEAFLPISVCSTSDGNYVIADLRHVRCAQSMA